MTSRQRAEVDEARIDELWAIAYGNEYLRLPRGAHPPHRYELAQGWLNSLSVRPHVRFARLIEAEVHLICDCSI